MPVLTPDRLRGGAYANIQLLKKYEINCDLGEGYGPYTIAPDFQILPHIQRANIACGFHAGDHTIMTSIVREAKKYGVLCGSHPGLPDRMGFGRRRWEISPDEIYSLIIYQTGALKAILESEGMTLSHVKPHGELYHYIERDEEIMRAALRATKTFNVPIVAAKSAHYEKIAKEEGVSLIQELYVDVGYNTDGTLASISRLEVQNPEIVREKIQKAVEDDIIPTINSNDSLKLNFDNAPFSVCIHSDMINSLENVIAAEDIISKINNSCVFQNN